MVVVFITATAGCAHTRYLAGIRPSPPPRTTWLSSRPLSSIEPYLVEKNIDGIMLLASKHYFEDGGTPQANDDYGYDALRADPDPVALVACSLCVTTSNTSGSPCEVIGLKSRHSLTGAFELEGEDGGTPPRVNDRHVFVLERTTNNKWRFLTGNVAIAGAG